MLRPFPLVAIVAATALLAASSLALSARSSAAGPLRSRRAVVLSSVPARSPEGAWKRRPMSRHSRHAPVLPEGSLVASVQPGAAVALYTRPFGQRVGWLPARTRFGSRQALSVVRTLHQRWLGVTTPAVPNGRLAWIDARQGGLEFNRTGLEIVVDLSQQTLSVRRNGTLIRRGRVGIGRPGSTTPTGRFAVTDKLSGGAYSAVYGCCILALSGRQTNLPAGWHGGDRLAIHGGGLGAVSAGCVHARETDLRLLMRLAPLGTPVTIHP